MFWPDPMIFALVLIGIPILGALLKGGRCECYCAYVRGRSVVCGECGRLVGRVKDGQSVVRDLYGREIPYTWDTSVDLWVKNEPA